MPDQDFAIAVFPFLKTSSPVRIGGYTFRSTVDTDGLPPDQEKAVREIAQMLFVQNDLRVKSASYAILPALEVHSAFETLLRLPEAAKTDRLVDAISLLLGRTDRLSDWAEQFYAARSQVAHEGTVRDWYFYAPTAGKKASDSTVDPGPLITSVRLASATLAACNQSLPQDIVNSLSKCASIRREDSELHRLSAVEELNGQFKKLEPSTLTPEAARVRDIVDLVWMALFQRYYWLKEQKQ